MIIKPIMVAAIRCDVLDVIVPVSWDFPHRASNGVDLMRFLLHINIPKSTITPLRNVTEWLRSNRDQIHILTYSSQMVEIGSDHSIYGDIIIIKDEKVTDSLGGLLALNKPVLPSRISSESTDQNGDWVVIEKATCGACLGLKFETVVTGGQVDHWKCHCQCQSTYSDLSE
jgi:hypothetical protein